jgi:hypothetical protein
MRLLHILVLLSFLVPVGNSYADDYSDFKYDDKTEYLKEFIDNFESSNKDNQPVYLEKLTVGSWTKMALVFGYLSSRGHRRKAWVAPLLL